MYIQADTDVYCVIGNPIKHSLSPVLHTYMFEYYGVNAVYVAFEPESAAKSLDAIRALGIKGANITVPFKNEAFRHVDETDDDTAFLEAVNTIKNENGKLCGFNTDYLGFMDMFEEYSKFCSSEDNIVVVGAGGVAVSVVYAMYKLGVKRIYLLNRSFERANRLKEKFEGKVEIVLGELHDKDIISKADIIVNCTPVGLNSEDLSFELDWVFEPIIIDVIYFDTPLIKKAQQKGLTAVNGLDMFIGQAYYSFKIWTGIEFDKENAKMLLGDIGL
ncbi:shikimate dehydrogenase [Hippea alviniae]|uniref:shikimate dehydrogenase n=1 Tax=Hippea alviniae TaxID=1279027 RepID=UPI0003B44745|nr:shikimate dehydrogenase [Hippea alviniae]